MNSRLALVIACVLWTIVVSAQTPVHLDPHHHVEFEDRNLRILDVNVAAGETGLDHLHANDVLTVSLSASETRVRTPGAAWGAVRPLRRLGEVNVTEYAGKPGTHAVQNAGRGLFRLMAVENLKQAGWTTTPALSGAGVAPLNETRAFRAHGVELTPDLIEITLRHDVPVVAVLFSGEAVVSRTGARPVILDQSKRWVVVDAGQPYRLRAQRVGAEFVVVEVR